MPQEKTQQMYSNRHVNKFLLFISYQGLMIN